MSRDYIPIRDRVRYALTKHNRTEDFYRFQYEKFFSRFYSPEDECLCIGPLRLPILSTSVVPTREEAYYAMEIGDILFPALFHRYGYVDEGPYEWGMVRVAPGDVVFDCGANLGIFSLIAAYRGADVFAFEPIPEACNILARTLSLNPDLKEHVQVIPCALGDEEQISEFTVLPDTLVGSSMVLPQTGRKICVSVTTIDAFVEMQGLDVVNFLKADIEGAERQMLVGAMDTLLQYTPKIAICTYHLADDTIVLSHLLHQANSQYVLKERWKKLYGYVP
ncbi:MAG TPA: FkbM family methyltransferase [Methanocorpusculum sp.]|nr:FkbM family methyltransferase [Methanocorpusculum sp.]